MGEDRDVSSCPAKKLPGLPPVWGCFNLFFFLESPLPGPKLVPLTPSGMLSYLPNFSYETNPDTCSFFDLQKNCLGSRQFGDVSKNISSRKRLLWPQNLLSRHPLRYSCPRRIVSFEPPLDYCFRLLWRKKRQGFREFWGLSKIYIIS